MVEKVTTMKLKVDLQCCKCYKKVKKVLCKFPQIRDQVYDEKHNIVTITVVCCDPEKLRDKLCCKGCGAIKSIEIVEPPKPTPQREEKKKKKPEPEPEPKPEPEPEPKPKPEPEPCPCTPQVVLVCPQPPCRCCPPPCRCCPPPCRCSPPPCRCSPPPKRKPCPHPIPIGECCEPCYEGRPGGPCFDGPPLCYGRLVCDGYGCCRPCYMGRCEVYICEENPSACTIV